MVSVEVIADTRRRAILEGFARGAGESLSVDEVALRHGLHRSVAFTHLERLADADLLARGTRRGARGRPARTYSYVGAAETSHPPRRHRLAAEILARALADLGPGGRELARRHGRTAGEMLAGTQDALGALNALGGAYALEGGSVRAHNCLFRDACSAASEVVCNVHAGLIEGAFAAHGTPLAVQPAGPDGFGGCIFRLGS